MSTSLVSAPTRRAMSHPHRLIASLDCNSFPAPWPVNRSLLSNNDRGGRWARLPASCRPGADRDDSGTRHGRALAGFGRSGGGNNRGVHSPQLPGVFHSLAPILDSHGYLAVGGLVLLEDFGVPVPGETVLIAASVYAGAGRLNIVIVVVVGVVAAIIGDNVGFAVGHFGGRRLALRWGRYVFVTRARLDHAQGFFERHGGKVVTVARFVEGLRQANGVIAGISDMAWRRFLAFNALGAVLWVAVWASVGEVAGSHLDAIYHQLVRYEIYVAVAAVILILGIIAIRLWRRRRNIPA